jgi:hypothetical protein
MTESESDYEYFMVYELEDDGTRSRVEVSEEDLQSILDPEEVFVIIKEPIRRIFIWKGAKSPVRKRFISSRVASGLQEELVKKAAFHRCKIVSVDQGDEVVEFLQAFNLESMEVKDKLQDMRYVRNIEKDATKAMGHVIEDESEINALTDQGYYSPALEELKRKGVDITASIQKSSSPTRKPSPQKLPSSQKSKADSKLRSKPSYKKVKKEEIVEKVLKSEIPGNYQRQNLIIGKKLYGAVSKVTNVFGNDIEKINWELVEKVPKGTFFLKNYFFRVYFNKPKHMVEAVEILKGEDSGSEMKRVSISLPDNEKSLSEKILDIEVPEEYKRINLIEEHSLYGATSKNVKGFGEEHEELEWELLEELPEGIVELKNHVFRVYFNQKEKIVEAIEVLQDKGIKHTKLKSKENNSKEKSKPGNKRNLNQIPNE